MVNAKSAEGTTNARLVTELLAGKESKRGPDTWATLVKLPSTEVRKTRMTGALSPEARLANWHWSWPLLLAQVPRAVVAETKSAEAGSESVSTASAALGPRLETVRMVMKSRPRATFAEVGEALTVRSAAGLMLVKWKAELFVELKSFSVAATPAKLLLTPVTV